MVVVSTSPVLSNAYAAALTASGWCAVRALCAGEVVSSDMGDGRSATGLVLVADEHGTLPVLSRRFFDRGYLVDTLRTCTVVAVGGRCAATALLAAVQQGARLVDAEHPLEAQIRAIRHVLSTPQKAVADGALTGRLHDRVREATALGALTGRERAVLEALRRGDNAADIAARWVVSLPTVRTHIRAVLRKLEVSSQLAAVAVAQRAACAAPTWLESRQDRQS